MSPVAVGVAGLVVALIAGFACSSSSTQSAAPQEASGNRPRSPATGADTRAVVAVVGDSNISKVGGPLVWDLTRGSGGLLTADHLDNNYVPLFVARAGAGIRASDCLARDTACRTYDFWLDKLEAMFKKAQVDAVVTDLGIDDAITRGTPTTPGYAGYSQKIDYFMRLVPHSAVALWTNLPCAIEPADTHEGCHAIDRALRNAPARWHNLTIVDWASVAGTRASYMDRSATPDLRIHYSDAGYAAWSALVIHALDVKFPAPK